MLLPPERPPYGRAAAVAAAVLAGYLLTLAPGLTLWDAGEFITAAHTLGIPHPPGTPLFVLIGRVWGMIFPLGAYAWRLNLLSALSSAAGAGLFFLCVDRILAGEPVAWRQGGAAAAALLAGFTLTTWQNSNETEVYAVATSMVAAVCWLTLRWRDSRGTPRAAHALLLVAYLLALSIGNHLLALLAGPAVIAFLWHVLRAAPAAEPAERATERAMLLTLAALWAVLVAVGLGSERLLLLAGALLLGAAAYAASARAVGFALAAVAVAAVGISTYGFLYIRSGLDPVLDMADPETWRSLVAVIRRDQYPPRSPLDNPLFPHGAGNPGRTVALLGQQLVNYFQYFDWQWARALGAGRIAVTALFAALGFSGIATLWRRDRSAFWLLGMLWLVMSLGLVGYMNFKPGFSLFWSQYPRMDQHEVRERDYFFTVSFQVWGVFAGIALAALAARIALVRRRAAVAVFALALLPLALNWRAATRRGPGAGLPRDFAYDLLQSVGPYGVLFTLGDNDTYPLWYAQEVEGVRRDVQVVNLMLANTDWYLRQLRRPPRWFDPAAAPAWSGRAPERPAAPLLDLTPAQLGALAPVRLEAAASLRAGDVTIAFPAGQVLYPNEQAVLFILRDHLGRRPVTYAISSGRGGWLGLDSVLVQRGLVNEVFNGRPDTVAAFTAGLQGLALDTALTRRLADSVFHYGGLLERGPAALEPAARQVATSLAAPLLELAQARGQAGDRAGTLGYLRKAARLNPSPPLEALLHQIETQGLEGVFAPRERPPRP